MQSKMNNIEIAIAVLEATKKELHVSEIAKRAIASGLVDSFSVDDFTKKLSQSLSLCVKRSSPIARVKNAAGGNKRGVYRLKRVVSKVPESSIPEPEQIEDSGFIGRGGEYAVMAELLFRGFNVSLMTVDKGIDVVAANEQGKYFHLQVKTANAKEGTYQFSIRRKSFDSNHAGHTFYIFVLRRDSKCDFVIMPSSQIANFIALGVIKGVETLSIRINYDGKVRKYSLNSGHDITIFANRFGQIC